MKKLLLLQQPQPPTMAAGIRQMHVIITYSLEEIKLVLCTEVH